MALEKRTGSIQRSIYLSDDIWVKVRRIALDRGITASELVEGCLKYALEPQAKATVAPVAPATPTATVDPFEPDGFGSPAAAPKPGTKKGK